MRSQRQSSIGRLPLGPRNPSAENAGHGMSGSSVVSGISRVSSKSSVTSRANSSSGAAKLSYIFNDSNNENNRRITTMESAALVSSKLRDLSGNTGGSEGASTGARDSDSLTTEAETRINGDEKLGGGGAAMLPRPYSQRTREPSPAPGLGLGRSSSGVRSGSSSRIRSGSTPRPSSTPRQHPVTTREKSVERLIPSSSHSSLMGEEVIIEEHRKNPSGDGYTVHKYLKGRLLGKGGFAKVYHCTSLDTNRNYAVKIVPKANLVKSRARQKLQAEIKIHRTLKHKHVCEFKHFFEDKTNCYLILELCQNQSMNELIKRRKRLTENEVRYYMIQMIDAVRYMHDLMVIHRDLKLGNLFIDRHMRVKVGDLGLASKLSNRDEKRRTICGTPNYIAPEVIDGKKETRGHSFEVDVWSMGVICFTTLVGKPPYESKDVKSTYQRILSNQYSFPSHITISGDAKDLIRSMLQTKPDRRPSLEQIISHPFLSNTRGRLPRTLPQLCINTVPEWRDDGFGNLMVVENAASAEENLTRSSSSTKRKNKKHGNLECRDKSSTEVPLRQPLSSRDPNAQGRGSGRMDKHEKQPEKTSSLRPSSARRARSSSRVKEADSGTRGGELETAHEGSKYRSTSRLAARTGAIENAKSSQQQQFQIYNDDVDVVASHDTEKEDPLPQTQSLLQQQQQQQQQKLKAHSHHKNAPQSRSSEQETEIAEMARRMLACNVRSSKEKSSKPGNDVHAPEHAALLTPQSASAPALASASMPSAAKSISVMQVGKGASPPPSAGPLTPAEDKDRDVRVMEAMHSRLSKMFHQIDMRAKGITNDEDFLLRDDSFTDTRSIPVNSGGAPKWVTRYVDYTSKYGLGFLLNDGSAGVYFNDSTKAVLAPKGDGFVYVERRKVAGEGGRPAKTETMCETHTLSMYPESLQKKVTLLKHFRNYLVEQQKRAAEEEGQEEDILSANFDIEAAVGGGGGGGGSVIDDPSALVYLKKWVRTKHAILFRLSNMTVQVVFYDHTEVLLSAEARVITYVDKKQCRTKYHLCDIMMNTNAEISKRLKYAKDILQQLISGATKH